MREMQGAEDEPEGNLLIVNDRRRIPIATQQITYFYTPPLSLIKKCVLSHHVLENYLKRPEL